MKGYKKPVAIINDEVNEGVYAASGSADCWTVSAHSTQDWNGSHHVFQVNMCHSAAVKHISSASTVTLTFSNTIVDAYAEVGNASFSGNTMTITRNLHANAYKSGDTATYKVWAKAADEPSTKALFVTGATISCTKTVNVQGEGGNGD